MLTFRLLTVGAAAVALVLPAAAQAGTVAQVNGVNTYTGSPGGETVALSNDAGKTVFQSSAIGLGGPGAVHAQRRRPYRLRHDRDDTP